MDICEWDEIYKEPEEYKRDEITETTKRNFEECDRLMEKWKEARARRRTAEAIAMGFSCWEDYDHHQAERSRQLQRSSEKRMAEKAALLGKSIEELWAEHPQQYVPRYLLPQLAQCDCDGK